MLPLVLPICGLLVLVTAIVHFFGLVGLSWALRRSVQRHADRMQETLWQGVVVVAIVAGLFALHAVQIWIYAGVYLWLGEFSSVESALYFSTTTFTTVGYGDALLSSDWRMLGAAESANGFLMIGWSTVFLVSVTQRVRMIEVAFERERDTANPNT